MTDLYLSLHASRRCIERGISPRHIEDAVYLGNRLSNCGDTTVYARNRLRVVLSDGGLVITA